MYSGPWYVHGRYVHEGLGWGGWLLWVLFMIAFWALVIMAVVWLVRSFTNRGPVAQPVMKAPAWRAGSTAHAEQILSERFAHGQIDENEYRARLEVLRGDQPMTAQAEPPTPTAPEQPEPPTPPAAPES